jgi:methylenetetrahydrofolate dehydrogenase (NADP+)/methenyltetrahydrofolate cyclohydrolase
VSGVAGARRLEGGPIAAEILAAVREDVERLTAERGRSPGLGVVLIGRDAPSVVYLERILRGCEKVGIAGRFVEIEGEATEQHAMAAIEEVNLDDTIDGIIVQMPLPPTIR